MKTLLAVTAIVSMLAATTAAVPTLTGKWQGETDGGATLVLDLTVKGTALTGTLTRNERSTELTDGKVSKNTFTFKATLNERTESFSGNFNDDQVNIWLDRQGPSKAIVLKRVKSE